MDAFECEGKLDITVSSKSNIALVVIRHEDDHILYHSVSIPVDVQEYIRKHQSSPINVVQV